MANKMTAEKLVVWMGPIDCGYGVGFHAKVARSTDEQQTGAFLSLKEANEVGLRVGVNAKHAGCYWLEADSKHKIKDFGRLVRMFQKHGFNLQERAPPDWDKFTSSFYMTRPHPAPAGVVKKTSKKTSKKSKKAIPKNRKQSDKPSGKRARDERITVYNSMKQRKQLGLESVPEHSTLPDSLDGNDSDGPLPREFTAPSRSPSPGRMQEVRAMKSSGEATVPKFLDNAATARFHRAQKIFAASKLYHAKP